MEPTANETVVETSGRPGRMFAIGIAWGVGAGLVLGLISGNLSSGLAAGLGLGAALAVTVPPPRASTS